MVLFGCTEDVCCRSEDGDRSHAKDVREGPWHCRTLCPQCTVPICSACSKGLQSFSPDAKYSTVPMSLANDNYYGYANWLIVTENVTWLECAAASICWSTILV